jgi:hypothetical protein
MRRYAVLLLLLAAASRGLGSDPARAQESRYKEVCADRPAVAGDTLYFCGSMDGDFVKFLSTNVSPDTSEIIVTSYGGQFHATK